ncbi:putative transcription factor B3-Domain family [Helianthus anomalus]
MWFIVFSVFIILCYTFFSNISYFKLSVSYILFDVKVMNILIFAVFRMYSSFVKFLDDPGSLKVVSPVYVIFTLFFIKISIYKFVCLTILMILKNIYRTYLYLLLNKFEEKGGNVRTSKSSMNVVKKWVVSQKREYSMSVITNDWKRVVADLNLPKTSLMVFHPLEENCLELSFFVNGFCGDCYYTFHRYGRLGVTIIEDAFVKQCYGKTPLDGTYQICYKGSLWSDDDLLIFRRIDDVVFDLTIYRNETEIVLTKIAESNADIFEISKADYFENVFKLKGKHKVIDDGRQSDAIPCCRTTDKPKRLPAEVVKRAGLSENLHSLFVQNMTGVVEVFDVKTELNSCRLQYAIEGWRKFMSDNQLRFGDLMNITYVTSQLKIVLTDVTSV